MAEILGLGVTHYPGLKMVDEDMAVFLRRTLSGKRVPEWLKSPRSWPAEMREEWGDDEGTSAARAHRLRCFAAFARVRKHLDDFKPDFVMIFGDDQYENFIEDIVPPFCVYILDAMESRPFARDAGGVSIDRNIWNEPQDTLFRHRGHAEAARFIANGLAQEGIHIPYAYQLRYPRGLAHAFINTLMYLDAERTGFNYPVVPFHVNCYGGALVRSRGGRLPPSDIHSEPDPPAPSAAACFDLGRALARVLSRAPWRVAMLASSSWSHAFLTAKNGWIYPDHQADRSRLTELREGRHEVWRHLSRSDLEDAGQHEFLNWLPLAGAMSELKRNAEIIDYVESYLFNSNKCFALFRA